MERITFFAGLCVVASSPLLEEYLFLAMMQLIFYDEQYLDEDRERLALCLWENPKVQQFAQAGVELPELPGVEWPQDLEVFAISARAEQMNKEARGR